MIGAEERRTRSVLTPEGVTLSFELASVPDRIGAFFVDFMLIHIAVVGAAAIAFFLAGAGLGRWALSLLLLLSFVLRNFYFIYFESRWGGQTPGKRNLGLRVISRDGGPLTSEANFVRNMTRDVEVFLPLSVLANPAALLPGVPGWAALIGLAWLLLFALLPLLNRDRLRVGDLVGGTLVVRMPKPALLPDLVAEPAPGPLAPGTEGRAVRTRFTDEQLDLYGIKELQVLEDLLRQHREQARPEVLKAVARRIMRKIGWPIEARGGDPERFLSDFYRAQRARLEHKLLFGERKTEKSRRRLRRPGTRSGS